jgi:hypothetical protein
MDHSNVTVTSLRAPTINWRCPTCHRPESFACSERFRANSNGKSIDIWLIYRCRRCDTTKNITVVERTPVQKVPAGLLRAAEDNDAVTARRFARDVGLLRRAGATIADGDTWTICPPQADTLADPNGGYRLRLVFPEELLVRLDGVVAAIAGLPRRVVRDRLRLPSGAPRPDALRLWSTSAIEVGSAPLGQARLRRA